MKQRNFEVFCAALLGFGQLCIMVGYDSESFILESVIHSIHERHPEKVSQYAGYYGQAVIFCSFMLACLIAPSILHVTTAKTLLIFSAVCYTLFPMGFLFFNIYFYFFTAIMLGCGTAFFFLGMGSYLSGHSTRDTIESNVSISWSVACCCLFLGAGILGIITNLNQNQNQSINGNFENFEIQQERRYSDREIHFLSAAFSGMSALGILTFCFLPSKNVENSLAENSKEEKTSFFEAFKLTCSTVISPKMVQLLPLTILGGFNVSFWLAIFPTAMNFTRQNSRLYYIPAVYSLGAGFGEVLVGILISAASKKIKGFGMKPTMVIGALSVCAYCTLVHFSTPFEAPMRPTSDEPMIFYQSYPLILLIAFLCGASDCCINGVRSVICAVVMPNRRSQAFSVMRLYHAAACMTCFFFSPVVPLYVYTICLPMLSIFSTFLFFRVVDRTLTMERKLTTQVNLEKGKMGGI